MKEQEFVKAVTERFNVKCTIEAFGDEDEIMVEIFNLDYNNYESFARFEDNFFLDDEEAEFLVISHSKAATLKYYPEMLEEKSDADQSA